MGIVVEYVNQSGEPKWIDLPEALWDYRLLAKQTTVAAEPDEQIPFSV